MTMVAGMPRRLGVIGDALRVVAGRHGDDAALALVRRQGRQPVERAALLEGGGELQVLELEPDLAAEDLGQRAARSRSRSRRWRPRSRARAASMSSSVTGSGRADRAAVDLRAAMALSRATATNLGDRRPRLPWRFPAAPPAQSARQLHTSSRKCQALPERELNAAFRPRSSAARYAGRIEQAAHALHHLGAVGRSHVTLKTVLLAVDGRRRPARRRRHRRAVDRRQRAAASSSADPYRRRACSRSPFAPDNRPAFANSRLHAIVREETRRWRRWRGSAWA